MNDHANLRNSRRVLALFALTALLGGCTALQPPAVENVTLHVLTAAPAPGAALPKRDAVIEVAPPRAWPGFDTPQMVYVRQNYELEHFAASRWVDTPPRMLGPLLARALEQSGSFRAVIQAPSAVPADYRVDIEIVRLQQSFAAAPSRAELTVRAQLTDVRAKRVVAARVFEATERAPTENAAGGVIAANMALQRMLGQIVEFCAVETAGR